MVFKESSIALELYPSCLRWSIAFMWRFATPLLKHSDFEEYFYICYVFSSCMFICIIARPSIELALKSKPADSKILSGRSLHFIHGSRMRSEALNLLLGSISRSREIIYLASLDIISGNLNWPLWILPYNSFSLYPLKGNVPESNAYSKTPKAHISTCLPSYSLFLTSSGAI